MSTPRGARGEANGPGLTIRRRGILAAAGAAVASIVAKQVSQPVIAAQGGTQGAALIIGANDTTGTANTATQPTTLYNGVSTIGSYYVADAFVAASSSGSGVQGYAFGNGSGVAGFNSGGTQSNASGVYGSAGSGIGVYGLSASGVGVQGDGGQDDTFNTTGFPIGVRGSVKISGYGVYGKAGNGFGVFGTAPGGVGVHGESGGGVGVDGVSTSSYGVQGTSTTLHGVVGRSGTSQGASGVVAVGTAPGTVGFQGVAQGGAIYAGYFFGSVSVKKRVSDGLGGDLGVEGAKFAIVKGADGKHRGMYAMESPECWFEDFGEAKLVGGKAEVKLDPLFAQHIYTESYQVFLTPYSGAGALRVTARRGDAFAVEEIGGTSSGIFGWRVVGKRNDITGERMPVWEIPAVADLPAPPTPPVVTAPPVALPSRPVAASAPQGSSQNSVQPLPSPRP